jgi:hypothetical protein
MLFKTRNFDDAKTVLQVEDLTVSLPAGAKAPPVLNKISLTIRARPKRSALWGNPARANPLPRWP